MAFIPPSNLQLSSIYLMSNLTAVQRSDPAKPTRAQKGAKSDSSAWSFSRETLEVTKPVASPPGATPNTVASPAWRYAHSKMQFPHP
ncbi:hypothetical protein CLCR_07815 [Cladophialophora carrionii]|uniref:Uncharacterized protein n=1 Tax=Cladophialophora carrionii TaxID=86049 RepID=A0A1C1CNM8_9EURO|nr:hypothetical protein CLCR_07815 [Cladophialophora carrionii]